MVMLTMFCFALALGIVITKAIRARASRLQPVSKSWLAEYYSGRIW